MDTKSFYGARPQTFLALVPENPQDSEADLSDYDPLDDPDYLPTPAEENGDTSFDSMDEEDASTSSSSKPPSKKKGRKGKNSLKTVSLAELQDTPDPESTPGAKKGRRFQTQVLIPPML